MPGPYPGSVAVTRLTGDGSLVAEALAVVGLFIADVLGAVVGVADVAQPVGAREVRPACGLVEQAQRVQPEDLGRAPMQGRDGERLARVALLRQRRGDEPLDDRLRALHTDGQRSHPLAEHQQQAGADTVDRLAEDSLAAGRRLGERSHHAGDALIVRARYAAAVVALARRHVQHPKELAEIHSRASVYAGRPSRPKNPAVRNNPRVQISVCDVGPRDGLQNDKVTLEPAVRAELCTRIAAAGVKRVEAASFVHPKLVPQMAGAEEVFAALGSDGVAYSSLVLNRKGLDRALQTSTTEIHVAYPVTDTFAQRNQNTTVEEAARTAEEIIGATDLKVTATISVAFGCPFEGHVDPGLVTEHALRMAAAGADEVILADTIGVGVPRQVRELVPRALEGGTPVGLHMHNTRNTGYANAIAGLEHGATIFDASVGGLGGCPFAPRATGNIATEDLLYLLENEGAETGIDLDALIEVNRWLAGVMGRDLPGLVQRAGNFAL